MKRKLLYKDNDLVWAKTKGHLWWPAQILSFEKEGEESFAISYINREDCEIVAINNIKPFEENLPAIKTTKESKYAKAIIEAQKIYSSRNPQLNFSSYP